MQHMSKHPSRRPFLGNLKANRRNAKLHKLLRAGIIKPMSKAERRQACDQAVMVKGKAG